VRKIDSLGLLFLVKNNLFEGCREWRNGPDYTMKTQTRVWQVLHKRRMTVGKVGEVSRRRFVASALSAAALAALPARSIADSKMQKMGRNE
jgi:hypothetical protein